MLQDLMNLKGVAVLSKQQQATINGQGTCRAYWPDYNAPTLSDVETFSELLTVNGTRVDFIGMSRDDAEAIALAKPGGRWCCDSCSSASWLQ